MIKTRFIGEVAPYAEGRVLELYSGAGFFSIPLSRGAQEVIAIESNRAAVRQARDNAAANKAWSVRFVEGQVDATLRGAELKPDVVSFHFGLPEKSLVDRINAAGCMVFSSATTVDAAVVETYTISANGSLVATDFSFHLMVAC